MPARHTSRSSARSYNLNDPLLVQYGKYMGNLVQGDLGTNFYGIKVSRRAGDALPDHRSSSP